MPSFTSDFRDFGDRLQDFYHAFTRAEEDFLSDATQDELKMENHRLKRQIDELEDKVQYLERKLRAKDDLFRATVGSANGDQESRKRERTPETDVGRKRSRDVDFYPNHSNGYHHAGSDRNQSTYLQRDPYYPLYAPVPTYQNAPWNDGALRYPFPPSHCAPVYHDIMRPPLQSTTAVAEQMNDTDQRNLYQHQRPRRLVCHACYANRARCDNGVTCSNCHEKGIDCVRTLCPAFWKEGRCYRPEGDCFKIHDEQGYTTTETDPFAPHANLTVRRPPWE